uniref:Uncharacterized protein n=1 Tax=Schistocephalus solidus TaxID=70667 RepID=A0A0X3NXR8_SCHSO
MAVQNLILYSFILICLPSSIENRPFTSFGLPRFDKKIENFCAECMSMVKMENSTVSVSEFYELCLQKKSFVLRKCSKVFSIDVIMPPNFFILYDPEEESSDLIKKSLQKIRQTGLDFKLFFLESTVLRDNDNQTLQGERIFISNDKSWSEICDMESLTNSRNLLYLGVSSQRLLYFTDLLNRYCGNLIQEQRFSVAIDTWSAFDSTTALETMGKVRDIFGPGQVLYVDKMLANPVVQAIIPFREFNTAITELWNAWHIQRIEIVIEDRNGPSPNLLLKDQPGVVRELLATSATSILAHLLVDIKNTETDELLPLTHEDLILWTLDCLIPYTHIYKEWDETQASFFASNILLAEYSDLAYELLRNQTSVVSTPTFTAALLTCTVDHWKGMPILLVAGKKMAADSAYVRVVFREQYPMLHPSRQYYAPPRKPDAHCLPKPRTEEIVFLLERNEACQLEPGIYCTSGLPCHLNGTFLEETFTKARQSPVQNGVTPVVFTNVLQLTDTTTTTTEHLLMHLIDDYLSPIPDEADALLSPNVRVRRDWSKEALVSDPLTTISHKYLSLVSRIWSPLLLTRNLHRIYAIDRAVDQLGFHYPTGDLLPTPKPQHFRGSDLIPKPPIPFLLPLVWTRAPFVLGIHPREDWRTIIERLADDIYYDCLEVNLVEGHSCNIALTGGRSVFGIELALRNKLKANSAQRPHITLWSASEYFNEGNILNLSKPWSLTDLDLYADRTYRLEDVGSLNLTRAEVCRRYSQRLQAELGGHPINWILLGMGPDGEIAGHGNHSDSSNNLMDPVQCSEKMPPANQPGMTFSWATIVQARNRVIFVVDQAVAHSWKKVAFFRRVVQPSMAYPEDKRLSLVEWLERPVSSPAILHLLDAPVDGPRILFYK